MIESVLNLDVVGKEISPPDNSGSNLLLDGISLASLGLPSISEFLKIVKNRVSSDV